MKNKYIDEFHRLRCSPDVMACVAPLTRASKELSEAMAVRQRVKRITLGEPGKYRLVDLCSGNALLPILAAFTLPVTRCWAVDKYRRDRPYEKVKRFTYIEENIHSGCTPSLIDDQTILTSVHACKGLAIRTVELFLETGAPYLVMMPCCLGPVKNVPREICDRLGKYASWCLSLALRCNGNVVFDENCLSPCNAIITAQKEKTNVL